MNSAQIPTGTRYYISLVHAARRIGTSSPARISTSHCFVSKTENCLSLRERVVSVCVECE